MNDTIDMLLEAADSLVGNTEEETINGYTLDEATVILEAADEILYALNEANGLEKRIKKLKDEYDDIMKEYRRLDPYFDKDRRDEITRRVNVILPQIRKLEKMQQGYKEYGNDTDPLDDPINKATVNSCMYPNHVNKDNTMQHTANAYASIRHFMRDGKDSDGRQVAKETKYFQGSLDGAAKIEIKRNSKK